MVQISKKLDFYPYFEINEGFFNKFITYFSGCDCLGQITKRSGHLKPCFQSTQTSKSDLQSSLRIKTTQVEQSDRDIQSNRQKQPAFVENLLDPLNLVFQSYGPGSYGPCRMVHAVWSIIETPQNNILYSARIK